MKHLSIDDIGDKPFSSGLFGIYFLYQADFTCGIKLIKPRLATHESRYKQASEEFETLKKAHSLLPDMFPKPIEMVAFNDMFGYMMEHIPMTSLRDAERNCPQTVSHVVINLIKLALEEAGMSHGDLHDRNILYDNNTGDFRVIDLDPEFVTFDGEEDEEVKHKSSAYSSYSDNDDYSE